MGFHVHVLEIVGILDFDRGELGGGEGFFSNEYAREELVFEGYPAQAAGEAFVVVAAGFEFVDAFTDIFVCDGAVALFEGAAKLVACHFLVPVHFHIHGVGRQDGVHSFLHHFHTDGVCVGQCVAYAPHGAVGRRH